MYDTPVISTRRVRAPQDSPPPPAGTAPPPRAAVALDARGVRVVGVAQRLGDHRVGVVDRALDAGGDQRLAGEPAAGRGPRRRRRRSTASAAAMVSRRQRRRAARALGLDDDVDAGALGGGLERLGGHVGVGDAGRARRDRDQPPGRGGRGAAAGRLRRGRRGRGAGGRGAGLVGAAGAVAGRPAAARPRPRRARRRPPGWSRSRRPSVKLFFTSARASWVSTLRCVASPPAGAAIRNARSAGPSLAPKSTGGQSRANARVGTSTAVGAAVRDRDAAGEPGRGGRLTGERVLGELVRVPGATGLGHLRSERSDDLAPCRSPARRRAGRAPG